MKDLKIFYMSTFILLSGSLLFVSCSSTPEDACNCIKKAANDYMKEGIKAGISELREPCKSLIDKFDKDAKGRALIMSCGDEVLKNVKEKNFIQVNGKTPDVTIHTFEDLKKFRDEQKSKTGYYKYLNTKITIKHVNLYEPSDYKCKLEDGRVIDYKESSASNKKYEIEMILKKKDFLNSQKINDDFNNHTFLSEWLSLENFRRKKNKVGDNNHDSYLNSINEPILEYVFVIPNDQIKTIMNDSKRVTEKFIRLESHMGSAQDHTYEVSFRKDFEITGFLIDSNTFIVINVKSN